MAILDLTRPGFGSSAAASFISKLINGAFSSVASWNDARNTRHALMALSDRELEDIGLTRGDIEDVAQANFTR